MIAHYINLKTMLSFVTGAVVAVILPVQVKLAVLFGIMSFVLNYPNVGSVIAMFLPAPVVMLDPNLEAATPTVGPGLARLRRQCPGADLGASST